MADRAMPAHSIALLDEAQCQELESLFAQRVYE